jgi:arsenate reductase
MAEGLLCRRSRGRYAVISAGVAPIYVHPVAVAVMAEWNIDISDHKATPVYPYLDKEFDYVVTLCEQVRTIFGRQIPHGTRMFHRTFVTPSEIGCDREDILMDFRNLRNDIDTWLSEIFPGLDPVAGRMVL